jgi:hypothetical protein
VLQIEKAKDLSAPLRILVVGLFILGLRKDVTQFRLDFHSVEWQDD